MYATNLPDGVVIPDMLVGVVEDEVYTEQAKTTIRAWASGSHSQFMQDFWHKQMDENISLCSTYGRPICVKLFSYMRQMMDANW